MTLNKREQLVLRAMAETVKPETEDEIAEYLRSEITYHKVAKAIRALRALNLVVIKQRPNATDVLELHPLVRTFIRRRFTPNERFSFISAIIEVYQRFIGTHKSELSARAPLSTLEYWTQNAELDIAAGKFDDAFQALAEVGVPMMSSPYPREFSRVARLLFSAAPWVSEHSRFKAFDWVFKYHIRILSYGGEYEEAKTLLEQYEKTVSNKDARYINYCEMRCFFNWVQGDFSEAVRWGKIGQSLKASSDVDTKFDVSHTLALAERDAGQPENALPVFLAGKNLSDVINTGELEESAGGAYYGNIGRCLHFMGQVDSALVCYQKSALLIEKYIQSEHVLNQGYVRAWIGELLVARSQIKLAEVFYRAAQFKWEIVSPPKAAHVSLLRKELRPRIPSSFQISDHEVESICLDWIMGDPIDARFE